MAAAVVAVDQATKAVVRARLELGERADVLGLVDLHRTRNDGLFGGHLSGAAVPVGIGTVVLIAFGLRRYARARLTWPRRLGAGLLLGGAVGNMADRLRLGAVTDFIARGDVNAFNLADLAIYAGLALLAGSLLRADARGTPA